MTQGQPVVITNCKKLSMTYTLVKIRTDLVTNQPHLQVPEHRQQRQQHILPAFFFHTCNKITEIVVSPTLVELLNTGSSVNNNKVDTVDVWFHQALIMVDGKQDFNMVSGSSGNSSRGSSGGGGSTGGGSVVVGGGGDTGSGGRSRGTSGGSSRDGGSEAGGGGAGGGGIGAGTTGVGVEVKGVGVDRHNMESSGDEDEASADRNGSENGTRLGQMQESGAVVIPRKGKGKGSKGKKTFKSKWTSWSLILKGTVYMLLLLAAARLTPTLNSLSPGQITSMCNLMRYPDDSREGRNIKEYLVSGVAYLRRAYPFQFDILFPWSYLALSKADPSLDITNLVKSNAFFDSFKYELQVLFRLRSSDQTIEVTNGQYDQRVVRAPV
ncbi:hypothetical protein DFP72DRAFT_853945 [Ephemerocybe angulata]|uniref:Uncharacterized protein n=1 Tax=Ephemerocybe angulata TaxID=980116 RepID=A0A8H6HJ37_9AGAR|nr:hypothetical protein DFP72DRAFT_853945 [Tulosesus angulatus]